MQSEELEYAGFWPRTLAVIIDSILIWIIIGPILTWVYGEGYWTNDAWIRGPQDFLISWIFPAFVEVWFWVKWQATPGKIAISAKIVDARTGNRPSFKQYIIRYFGYFVSALPLFLGFIWVAFDARKQGWHDKLAGTVVIRTKGWGPTPVSFPERSENER